MMQDRIARSSKTLSRMAKVLRKICTKAMKEYQKRRRQQMGGQQEFVVIDESNFRHKRKVSFIEFSAVVCNRDEAAVMHSM